MHSDAQLDQVTFTLDAGRAAPTTHFVDRPISLLNPPLHKYSTMDQSDSAIMTSLDIKMNSMFPTCTQLFDIHAQLNRYTLGIVLTLQGAGSNSSLLRKPHRPHYLSIWINGKSKFKSNKPIETKSSRVTIECKQTLWVHNGSLSHVQLLRILSELSERLDWTKK